MLAIDITLLIIWIIAGLINIIPAMIRKEKISLCAYFLCWFVLILELIKNLI